MLPRHHRLNRAAKLISPGSDMSVTGAPNFADENEIAPYFVDNVMFMAKNGFISGVGENRFAPQGDLYARNGGAHRGKGV